MSLFGINNPLVLRTDKEYQNVLQIRFTLYDNVTKEISYLVYEGNFSAGDIKEMTPYERSCHLKYVIDRITAHNEAIEKATKN